MPRRRARQPYTHISDLDRGRIIGMREMNASYRDIARRVGRSVSVVERVCRNWFEEGISRRREGSGRRTQTTPREDRHLIRLALSDRFATSTVLAQQWRTVTISPMSASTVRHRLLRSGIQARQPLLRLPLTPRHRSDRLQWCIERRAWQNEWHDIVFSDESRFCLGENDARRRVHRRSGERRLEDCIRTRHTAPTRGVLVWGAIGFNSRAPLKRINGTITSARYVNDILQPVALPFLQRHPRAIFQQDNAAPHTAASTRAFFRDHNVPLLPWPPRSPDLSPIENLWDMVKRRLTQYASPPSNLDELWTRVNAAWLAIPQDTIKVLFNSMPRRVEQVIQTRGGHTDY